MSHFFKKITRLASILFLLLLCSTRSFATTFTLPPPNETLLGEVKYTASKNGEMPATIAQRYNLGVNAILTANPGIAENTVFVNASPLQLATQFLLPPLPRKGIIINLPEMRMYYFPAGTHQVMTFPIGIGKIGKTIPITNTSIVRKVVNPTWIPTAAIREFNQEKGVNLPQVMPAGPDNPLGPYAIYLRIPTYLIHSTIFPESIGRRASFGCIRMNESDIKQFFPLVTAGTTVTIVDMPNKVGWQDNHLYIETHPPLEERKEESYTILNGMVDTIESALPHNSVTMVNWQVLAYLSESPDSLPHDIGVRLK